MDIVDAIFSGFAWIFLAALVLIIAYFSLALIYHYPLAIFIFIAAYFIGKKWSFGND